MNNKSDKKHKRKQKQKQKQTKHKKKTASHKSKTKKEIKGGGKGFLKGLFSRNTPESQTNQVSSNGSYNSTTKNPPNKNKWKNPKTFAELQQPLLPKSKRLANEPPANSRILSPNASQTQPPANLRNSQQTVSQAQSPPPPPPLPPNAQPQGFNTLKAQSRCSIM